MNIKNLYRKLIFLGGDLRRERAPLGFAWGSLGRLIGYTEAYAAEDFGDVGYIGLHRNRGDMSNLFIPGFMKHAWIHTGEGDIIEAVSEGVLRRHSFHALLSDYAVILKPAVNEAARLDAVDRDSCLVGANYDQHFSFDLEIEDKLFADKTTALANMKQFGLGVSCTELVALGYVGHRRELGLYRVKKGKRLVIMPDNFLTVQFDVVWASKYTTPETAAKLGLHEEGCCSLENYWSSK